MSILTSGTPITAELADRMLIKFVFMHDFAFQTGVTYSSQRLIIPRDMTLVRIYAAFTTAPTGANGIFNVKRNGTELWSGGDRPTLLAGTAMLEKYGISEVFALGDYLEWVDVQKGSTVAGGYGAIVLEFK
jgi:hypothetical protein